MTKEALDITFIDQLNDDCLLKISDYLTVEDQLLLWQATKSSNTSTWINSVLTNIWQKPTKHIIKSDTFSAQSLLYLHDFLECISETVEELELRYLPKDLVEKFSQHQFPYVKKLKYYGDEECQENDNRDIEILTDIFPSLTSLTLAGLNKGEHLSKFRNLTEFNFNEWHLNPDHFMDICEHLKLKKLSIQCLQNEGIFFTDALLKLRELEELSINLWSLSMENIPQILDLPKLRKLRFTMAEDFQPQFNAFMELRGLDIIGATFNDSIYSCNTEMLKKLLPNLQRLTIIEDDGWNNECLMRLMYSLPSLEQVNLIETNIFRTDDQLWDMVCNCPKLKVLNLSKNSLGSNFFISGKTIVENALSDRNEQLHLNFHNSGLDKDLIPQHFRHKNLRVSFQALDIDCIAEFEVQLEFKTREL